MTPEFRKELEKNKYIKKIGPLGRVTYTPEFIEYFIREKKKGRAGRVIYDECGLAAIYTKRAAVSLLARYQGKDLSRMKQGIKYSEEELKKLRKHPCVQSCTSKSIMYTGEFKKKAVVRYQEGMHVLEIFEEAGLGFLQFNERQACRSISNWLRKVRDNQGDLRTLEKTSGREKKARTLDEMNKDEQIEYLRAENLYLKELQNLVQSRIK